MINLNDFVSDDQSELGKNLSMLVGRTAVLEEDIEALGRREIFIGRIGYDPRNRKHWLNGRALKPANGDSNGRLIYNDVTYTEVLGDFLGKNLSMLGDIPLCKIVQAVPRYKKIVLLEPESWNEFQFGFDFLHKLPYNIYKVPGIKPIVNRLTRGTYRAN